MLLRLAWRNLWRNRRRTQLTMAGMVFATALLIFTLAMYDGMLWDMIENVTEVMTGHVVIAREGYQDRPELHRTIGGSDEARAEIASEAGVRGVCSRVSAFALLSCGPERDAKTQPGRLTGIDPLSERRFGRLARCVTRGRFLDSASGTEAVLGIDLARSLGAGPGAELVVISQAADGSTVTEVLPVAGILDTGDQLRDGSLVLVGLETMQRMFGLEGRLHTLHVFLDRPLAAREAAAALSRRLSGRGLEVLPWQELQPQLAQVFSIWLGMQVFTMGVFYFGIVLITFSTMSMTFLERLREFGMLRAIGLKPRQLVLLIILEGGLMSSLAGLLGMGAGALLGWGISVAPIDLGWFLPPISWGGTTVIPRIRGVLSPVNVAMPGGVMMLLGAVVALFPAWRLFFLRPVEALREG
ncbi:MAG TPA: ABC transporter permease [Candidatus Ozemobacteraceae bacterium]|nr:ABC transporter permease [Candidatus Ozemobacteraceae bacterium]